MSLLLPNITKLQYSTAIGLALSINILLCYLLYNLSTPSFKKNKIENFNHYTVRKIHLKKHIEKEINKPLIAANAPNSVPSKPKNVDFLLPEIESSIDLPDVTFLPTTEINIDPSLDFDLFTQGIIQGSQIKSRMIMAKPTYQIPPKYPIIAKRKGIEGYIILHLLIDINGNPLKYKVIQESPKGVFLRTSLRSVMRWKFIPPQNEQQWQQITLKYNLED